MTTNFDTDQVVSDATSGLRKRFPAHSAEELEAIVREELAKFEDRPVRDYLTILIERAARARLRDSLHLIAAPAAERTNPTLADPP